MKKARWETSEQSKNLKQRNLEKHGPGKLANYMMRHLLGFWSSAGERVGGTNSPVAMSNDGRPSDW